jgi:hypothetical protein
MGKELALAQQDMLVMAPDGCGVFVLKKHETKTSRVSAEGPSRLGDGREIRCESCGCGTIRVSVASVRGPIHDLYIS